MKPFRAKNLSFIYKKAEKKALDNIDLEIEEGEFIGILGRTGAGKTTLTLTMNGIIPHLLKGKLEGMVLIFGKDSRENKISDFFRYVGILFQDFETQLFSSSVEREIVFGLENQGIPKDEIKKRIKIFAEKMGISHLLKRNPFLLSGGEKQRVVITSILAMEPFLLVFDEPTTDIDPEGREGLYSLYRELKGKRTIFVVEHDLERLSLTDRLVILNNGRVVASGKSDEILTNVELFEKNNLRPLDISLLFKKLGSDKIPGNLQEAKAIFDEKNYKILPSDEKGRASTVIVSVENLFHFYGSNPALENINIDIREGELVSIIGPNGSGKSTLLKLIAGMIPVQKGRIYIKKREIREWKEKITRIVGFGFQNPDYQLFKESVWEEVGFSLELSGIFKEDKKRRIEEILSALELFNKKEHDPFSLSKGERQKLVVASILATEKEIVILDEPTTGLDPYEVDRIMEIIRVLKRKGVSVIFVTHSLDLAFSSSDWIIVLNEGKVFLQGEPKNILKKVEKIESIFKLPSFLKFSCITGGFFLSVDEALRRIKHDI